MNLIENLTSEEYVIKLYCYDIAPYNFDTFYSVTN